jgi:tRNA threonylcarbamoyladenosine biosynthesis protein TsaB
MKILAIDTSGEACSAALLIGTEITQRLECQPRRHGELLLGMMEDLLAHAGMGLRQLDALAFGRGPGSFTGVRIAAAAVQGAAFGAELPVVPVSTLAALAQGCFRSWGCRQVLPALDARMGELYWGAYAADDAEIMRSAGVEEVTSAQRVSLPQVGRWCGVGRGWSGAGDLLSRRLGSRLGSVWPERSCESQDVATIAAAELAAGRFVPAEQALPIYLRDRVTAVS